MTEETCKCGYPARRPNDSYCLKCNYQIPEHRIPASEVIEFPADFLTNLCECSETVKANWGTRAIGETNVCCFCNKYVDGAAPDVDGNELYFFDHSTLSHTYDPTKPQYKVITQKDRFFSSKFDPALIERALNEYAHEGWVFKSAVSADFGSMGMSRNELIIFMEKEPNGKIDS